MSRALSPHQACIHGNDSFYLSNTPDTLNDVLMLKLQGVHGLRMAKMESVRGCTHRLSSSYFAPAA